MDDVRKVPQRKVSAWFFVSPFLVGVVYCFVRLIVNVNSPPARWFDGFLWALLFVFVSGIVSGIIYYVLLNRVQKPFGREFNGRDFCREVIRSDLLDDGVKIAFFTDVQDSHRDVRNWGSDGKTKIYSELVKTKRNPPGYLFVAMNMEKGREDDIAHRHVPMNFTNDYLRELRYDVCNGMSDKPERKQSREVIQTDEMLGRSRKERTETPYDPEDEELEEE